MHANKVGEQLSKGKALNTRQSPQAVRHPADGENFLPQLTQGRFQVKEQRSRLSVLITWHLNSKPFKTKGIHGLKQGELLGTFFFIIIILRLSRDIIVEGLYH